MMPSGNNGFNKILNNLYRLEKVHRGHWQQYLPNVILSKDNL